ncbi:hypothetical protein Glove_627g33 [Diversispora epigaea]|uniref:Uncharacterized protein n=1 Tax=Diversispora epigaea TaxID=1348612 RepID=A0A397GBD1_9GLOM|nr:hypothetical protein Glove_627g33 [Diversispora epigaea]
MIGCQGFPNCNMGIKVPDIVSDILVSSDKCNRCTQNPEIPYYKLKIKFIPNKVPPWISEEYLGCVGGCDDFLNEYFVAIRSNQSNRMPLSSINQNNQANQPQSSQSSQPSQPSQSSRNFETSLTRQGNNYTESGSTNFTVGISN